MIPIVFICDDNYAMPTAVAITSIICNSKKSTEYKIYVLGLNLQLDNIEKLASLSRDNCVVEVMQVELSEAQKKVVQKRERVSRAALFKFELPNMFPQYNKLLYLDSDTIIQDDLEEFFLTNIVGYYAAVVSDTMTIRGINGHLKKIKFKPKVYFNSGVLLLNLEKMRRDDIPRRLLDYRINGENVFMDQDALNVVFNGNVLLISPYYNLLNCFFEWQSIEELSDFYCVDFPNNCIDIYNKATILHLGDKKKPWLYDIGYLSSLYKKYYEISPYKDSILPLKKESEESEICTSNFFYAKQSVIKERKKVENPKLSILMPSLNVGNYIRECISSVVNQTLEDIEIICIDAGSTDDTLEILEEYGRKDKRITIIHSDKKSYGYQMNLGLNIAQGDYIGIVETDDWIENDMFFRLLNAALENDVDMAKSNYYWYWTKPELKDEAFENLCRCNYETVFCPIDDKILFTTAPAIWSGIYRRKMLIENNIKFNESLGASFQDTSFHFMVCTAAQSCFLLKDYLLHYRRDNENSSVNSNSKVFCINDEMHYFEQYLDGYPSRKEKIQKYYFALKYEKYRWNYIRLSAAYQWAFLKSIYNEFLPVKKSGLLDETLFEQKAWKNLNDILNNPVRYFQDTCKTYATRPNFSDEYPARLDVESKIKSPKVSIIIPIYNGRKYIKDTLESALAQDENEIEIVV